jgi:hypothetical protein
MKIKDIHEAGTSYADGYTQYNEIEFKLSVYNPQYNLKTFYTNYNGIMLATYRHFKAFQILNLI